MGAREKLNKLAFLGCVGVATAVGAIAQSWWAFAIALALTAGVALVNRDIRLKLARRRPWRRPAYR
jgi:hypothetical protein